MNNIQNIKEIELIRSLCLLFGPSGCENDVSERIAELVSPLADEIICDKLGNLICRMSFGNKEKRQKVMLSAHMDEVGFMIDGIDESGMLTFGTVGGIDPAVCAGRKITVRTENGHIGGVIASKAIHHKTKEERSAALPVDKLYIDIGAKNREDAQSKVKIGNYVCFDSEFITLGKNGETLKSKALDDRMGCAAMIEIMQKLSQSRECVGDKDVYFCFTVREEIGYSGASAAACRINPGLALVLETTAIGDLPDTPEHKRVGNVGKGVVVSFADRATIYDREAVNTVLSLAKEKNIPAEPKRYVSGGNDAGKIHKALCGIKTIALSVPTRYLHSPACLAVLSDYRALRDLSEAIIKNHSTEEKDL